MGRGMGKVLLWVLVGMMIIGCQIVLAAEIMPRYTYVENIQAGLSITDGRATANGSICPYDGRASRVEVRLQQYIDGRWLTIGIWYGSNSGGVSEAVGSEEVDQGFGYRTYTYGVIYDENGNILEALSKYSGTKNY